MGRPEPERSHLPTMGTVGSMMHGPGELLGALSGVASAMVAANGLTVTLPLWALVVLIAAGCWVFDKSDDGEGR